MSNFDVFGNNMLFVMNELTDRYVVQRSRGAIQNMASVYNAVERYYVDEAVGSINIGVVV
jgi:hypothetical protein